MASDSGSLRYEISYEDDRKPETFKVKPKHLVRFELDGHSFDEDTSVYQGFLLAFYAASQPGAPKNATDDQLKDAFLKWLDGVDEIETLGAKAPEEGVETGDGEAVPTQ